MVRGVSMAGELIAILDFVTGEDGSPQWQPKKVFSHKVGAQAPAPF
jgi:hypothetical protein